MSPVLDAEGRISLLQSARFAWLLAVEVLTPTQRGVLVLRDVFGYSTAQTATALDLTEANAKTTLHRARRALVGITAPVSAPQANLAALGAFLGALTAADASAVEAVLARDVVGLSDGGGEFTAARIPLLGAAKVAKTYLGLLKLMPDLPSRPGFRLAFVDVNGTPALSMAIDSPLHGSAPRWVFAVDTNEDGLIVATYSVMTTRKLTAIPAP